MSHENGDIEDSILSNPMQKYAFLTYHEHGVRQLALICPLKLRIQCKQLTQIRCEVTQS